MGKTHIDDGVEDTELSLKGNGLQRSVAFALIRLYAEKLRYDENNLSVTSTGLFLCVDEPEIWMHPRAQLQLAQALSTIADKEQVWVSTHSPYMLKKIKGTRSEYRIFIFNDIKDDESTLFKNRVKDSEELGVISPGEPSLAEITYKAFQIATPEYHSELLGLIQNKTNKPSIVALDNMFTDEYHLPRRYKRLDSRYLKTAKNGEHISSPVAIETLPIHLRNLIDHPESIQKKGECLRIFRSCPSEFPKCSIEQIEDQDNCIIPGQLEKSIKLLESICLQLNNEE
jgi:hypothetical protein